MAVGQPFDDAGHYIRGGFGDDGGPFLQNQADLCNPGGRQYGADDHAEPDSDGDG